MKKPYLYIGLATALILFGGVFVHADAATYPVALNNPPTISVTGPSTLTVGQTGTWTATAHDTDGNLSLMKVSWGDGMYSSSTLNGSSTAVRTFYHAYTTVGTKYSVFTVYDTTGLSASTTKVVQVSATSTLTYYLSVSKTGLPGTVTGDGGINCGLYCLGKFQAGQTVTLHAVPDSLSAFYGWKVTDSYGSSTDCGVFIMDQNCSVLMNGNKTVQANFILKPTINILAPNGGEVWQLGTTHAISWNSANAPAGSVIQITLCRGALGTCQSGNGGHDIVDVPYVSSGIYQWSIPNTQLTGNDYYIWLSLLNSMYGNPFATSTSKALFSIISAPTSTPPYFTAISGPSLIAINTAGTWTVSTADPDANLYSLQVSWGDLTGGMWDIRGATSTIVTNHTYTTTGTKTVTFTVKDSTGLSAVASQSVSVYTPGGGGTCKTCAANILESIQAQLNDISARLQEFLRSVGQ